MNLNIPAVFPVVTKDLSSMAFQGLGSAFFIDAKGLFITAAHTFKHPFREYYALINGERYEITRIWSEYTDYDYQQPKIYKDLFIGRVKDFNSPNFYKLRDKSADLGSGTMLSLEGYQLSSRFPEKKEISHDDLFADVISGDYQAPASEDARKATRLEFIPILATYQKQDFGHINKHSDLKEEFTNGFSIAMDVKEPHGHSGGPLLLNDEIVGMLIGETGAISVEYINEKLAVYLPDEEAPRQRPGIAVKVTDDNRWLERLITSVHDKLNIAGSSYEAYWKDLCFISSEDFDLLANKPNPSLLRGFGGTESNYRLGQSMNFVHLVILTPNAYKEAGLSMPELEAVVMHEIGHVLNMYEQKPVPSEFDSFLNDTPFDKTTAEKIAYENRLNNELYADDYVRQQGYTLPLIGGMKKYLNTNEPANVEIMQERIQCLESDAEPMIGVIKVLREIPKVQ